MTGEDAAVAVGVQVGKFDGIEPPHDPPAHMPAHLAEPRPPQAKSWKGPLQEIHEPWSARLPPGMALTHGEHGRSVPGGSSTGSIVASPGRSTAAQRILSSTLA